MAAKRGQGDYYIQYSPEKKRWVGWASFGNRADGKRDRVKRTRKTRAEVKQALDEVRAARDRGEQVNERLTAGAFLEDWLSWGLNGLAAKTCDSYRGIVTLHLVPALGSRPLRKLTVRDVNAFLTAKNADFGPDSVRLMKATLRKALGDALSHGLVHQNVAALAQKTPRGSSRTECLTQEEARRFLEMVSNDPMGLCYTISMIYGLRRGEALGLTWSDLDWERKTLLLSGGVVRRGADPSSAGGAIAPRTVVERGPLKTSSSARVLALTDELLAKLRRHHAAQAEEKLRIGSPWGELGLVFPSATGGVLDPDNYSRRFKRLCIRLGLGPRSPHVLRHTAASLMLAQGTELHVVSEILGHSSIAVTKDVYGHLVAGEKPRAADRMTAALLGG